MKIIYRTSDTGYNKVKPEYINNENCLKNFVKVFSKHINDIIVIADNPSDELLNSIKKYIPTHNIMIVKVGHGAGTFNIALDMALQFDDNEIVYFVENDYLHRENSPIILNDMFNLGAHYGTLYLHPDKFITPENGGNPEVDTDGGYPTKIYKGEYGYYALFNSTTMTFASKVKTLKSDIDILKKWTSTSHPFDYEMFLDLRKKGRSLVCPLNAYSTHGEVRWLSEFIDWENEI
jgi:hypothetical protein